MEKIEGTLRVTKSKDGKNIYKCQYTDAKGKAKEAAIMTHAVWFKDEDAVDGAQILFEREGGLLTKVTIVGKEEVAPQLKPPTQKNPAFQQNRQGGQRSFTGGGYGNTYRGSQPNRSGMPATAANLPDATAPYNFVPQNCVLEAPEISADEPRYSGSLVCSLKALTPLLVSGEQQQKSTQNEAAKKTFFTVDGCPVIPGTSLKGLIRSYVETLTCSAISFMNDRHIFWRNFDDNAYKLLFLMGKEDSSHPRKHEAPIYPQKAGYLIRRGADYYIVPVTAKYALKNSAKTPGYLRVQTGPMPKKKFDYDFALFPKGQEGIPLADKVIDDFLLQITPVQEMTLQKYSVSDVRTMKEDAYIPVFYMTGTDGQIDAIGLARYFRHYKQHTPGELRDNTATPLDEGQEDFASRLFGYAKKEKSLRGKVAFSCAVFPADTQSMNLRDAVLGEPHPTCFAHYLQQDKTKLRTMRKNNHRYDVNSMSNYNGLGKIRGRKFYWHKGELDVPQPPNDNKNCQNKLVPLCAGSEATFTVYLDRLSLIELGAVLEALLLPSDNRHKIGMGKSFGLGSVEIRLLHSDVAATRERYGDLEARFRNVMAGKRTDVADEPVCFESARNAFRQWLVDALKAKGQSAGRYEDLPHIAAFLHLTDFVHKPDINKTKNMELKEFKDLRVLPEALAVR